MQGTIFVDVRSY